MEDLIAPAIVLCIGLGITVLLSNWLFRIGRELLAWWLFILLAFPSLTILLSLFVYDWPLGVDRITVERMVAEGFGTLLAASLLSSVGLLVPVYRAISMLTVLFFLANSDYIFGVIILNTSFPGIPSIFFSSVIISAIYAFTNIVGQGGKIKVDQTTPVNVEVVSDEITSGLATFSKQEAMKETNMPYATPRDRIAQVVYVVGALVSVVMVVTFTLLEIDSIRRTPLVLFLIWAWSIAPYGIGWALRWIINGTSSSVIDYLRPN